MGGGGGLKYCLGVLWRPQPTACDAILGLKERAMGVVCAGQSCLAFTLLCDTVLFSPKYSAETPLGLGKRG